MIIKIMDQLIEDIENENNIDLKLKMILKLHNNIDKESNKLKKLLDKLDNSENAKYKTNSKYDKMDIDELIEKINSSEDIDKKIKVFYSLSNKIDSNIENINLN